MSNILYEIENLSYSYDSKKVIDGITQTFKKGMFYGVLGPNGCGKTTFLDLVAGYKQPEQGSIILNGKDLSRVKKSDLSRLIALVSQNFYINFPYTVSDVVMMGRYPHIPRFSTPSERDFEIVNQVLNATEVDKLKDQLITELSGGERQRTVFARALAQETEVLLLDEATSNLDINHTIALLDIVRHRMQEKNLTVISVFQDINLAAVYCDEIVFMKSGKIMASGKSDDVLNSDLIRDIFHVESEIRFEKLYNAKQVVFKTGAVL